MSLDRHKASLRIKVWKDEQVYLDRVVPKPFGLPRYRKVSGDFSF